MPVIVKHGMVHYTDTGVNAVAWGNGGSAARQRRQVALELQIINEDERLTQTRIIDWLRDQRQNHPQRAIFEEYVGRQPHRV